VNLAVVGAFVLLLGVAAIAALLWLAAGGAWAPQVDLYQAIEEESVAGLNVDASVKFNGVDVGKVTSIKLDPLDPGRVRLVFAIVRGTPIKVDTLAMLKTQGLTGIAYVELDGGGPASQPLRAGTDGALPQIRTKPSLGARLENLLAGALSKLDTTTTNIDKLLSDDNRRAVTQALADIATVAHTVAARSDSLDAGLADAAKTFKRSAEVAAALPPVIARIGRSADAIEALGRAGSQASHRAGAAVGAAGDDLQRLTSETLPALQRLMGELDTLAAALQRLSEQTERNPASLLFGRGPQPEGPGEGGPTPARSTAPTETPR